MATVKFKSPVGNQAERDQIWPKEWRVTKGFCISYSLNGVSMGFHTGQDLYRDKGTEFQEVYAIGDGIVTFSEEVSVSVSKTWGNVIVINHGIFDDGNGKVRIMSRYAHLAGRAVKKDQFVDSNTVIGTVGKGPGVAKGGLKMDPHLHFDISKTDALFNKPLQWDNDSDPLVRAVYLQPDAWLRQPHNLIIDARGNPVGAGSQAAAIPQDEVWIVTTPTKIRMDMTSNPPVETDLNSSHTFKLKMNTQEHALADSSTWVQISDSDDTFKGFWVKKKDSSKTYISKQ